jgi:hypothetical protein
MAINFQSHWTSNRWWNLGFICEYWNQRAVKAVDAHTSPNKPKSFKQMSACQEANGSCFLGQERCADGGIYEIRDHNNVRSVLRNTKKKKLHRTGHSEQKAWIADIRCNTPPWQCASAYGYICSHSSAAGAFQLGVVWPPSLQPWSPSERLPPIYLSEKLAAFTALQQ